MATYNVTIRFTRLVELRVVEADNQMQASRIVHDYGLIEAVSDLEVVNEDVSAKIVKITKAP